VLGRQAFTVPTAPVVVKPVVRGVNAADIRDYQDGKLFTPDDDDETVTLTVNKCRLEATAILQFTEGDTMTFRLYHAVVREKDDEISPFLPSGSYSTATFST
jgi:hypothetical protein